MQGISGHYSTSTTNMGNYGKIADLKKTVLKTSNFESAVEVFASYRQGTITNDEINEYLKSQLAKVEVNRPELLLVDEDYDIDAESQNRPAPIFTREFKQKEIDFLFGNDGRPTTFDFDTFFNAFDVDENGNAILPSQKPVMSNKYLPNGVSALVGNNNLIIGEGSEIDLGDGYSLRFYQGSLRYCHNDKILSSDDLLNGEHKNFFEEAKDIVELIKPLIYYANGNTSTVAAGRLSEVKGDYKEMLRRIGIDPTQPFTINGTRFKLFESKEKNGSDILAIK